MTTRNLDALFHPRSIALIGASGRPGSVGDVVARNLMDGGFAGPVLPVNPHADSIRSALAYHSVAELPRAPDLAVIATPAATVPGLVSELGARGCRAAVVISAGFEADPALRASLLAAARPNLLRILGPNCLGFIAPKLGLNASFAHLTPAEGEIALVSQSGAIAAAAMDWAHGRGLGFSNVVSIGDAIDIDLGDVLDHLALDPATHAILLYIESVTDARKFMSAGRIAACTKPVIVIKAGRSAAGAKAAFSHTGAMAGADAVYDAAFRRAGMLRVGELRELFDTVATLGAGLSVAGERLAILTNGGGAGVLAVDALDAQGGALAELSAQTLAAIARAAPSGWSQRNPADIRGDAQPGAYGAALGAMLADPETDAVLVMHCPTAASDSTRAGSAVIDVAQAHEPEKLVLTCWLGDTAVAEARRAFGEARLPTYETPTEAVRAFMHLVRRRRGQEQLLLTPAPFAAAPDPAAARAIIERALSESRGVLTDPEARAVLAAYGVPVIESRTAGSAEQAAQAAAELTGPLALKILSRELSHKSDVGGVALDLSGREQVLRAAKAMLERVRHARPDARIDGFVLEPMVVRPEAEELIIGLTCDPTFGPTVLFGHGGLAAEVIGDHALALPPLDDVLARELIGRTRVARRLGGYRQRPAADLQSITQVLIAVGQLAADLPEIAELDINPLLADSAGVLALDARIAVRPIDERTPRMAILPYPEQLKQMVDLEGERLVLRPIRPQDSRRLVEMVARCSPEDVRFRFGGAMRMLSPVLAAQLAQIDYDRQMAFVAEDAEGATLGVGRLLFNPEGDRAEFTLLVRTDQQQRGLGLALLTAITDYAQARNVRELWSEVDLANERMLELGSQTRFRREPTGDPDSVRLVKELGPEPADLPKRPPAHAPA